MNEIRSRHGLIASLDGVERTLVMLRRRILIVGLSIVALVAVDLTMMLAARA